VADAWLAPNAVRFIPADASQTAMAAQPRLEILWPRFVPEQRTAKNSQGVEDSH
jgi:hypothetical protein